MHFIIYSICILYIVYLFTHKTLALKCVQDLNKVVVVKCADTKMTVMKKEIFILTNFSEQETYQATLRGSISVVKRQKKQEVNVAKSP